MHHFQLKVVWICTLQRSKFALIKTRQNWREILKLIGFLFHFGCERGWTLKKSELWEWPFWESESVCFWEVRPKFTTVGVLRAGRAGVGRGGPTCRGCADGFICGGGGVANTTEGVCPGGNEGCKRQEKVSTAENGEQSEKGEHVDASYCIKLLKGFFSFIKNFILK